MRTIVTALAFSIASIGCSDAAPKTTVTETTTADTVTVASDEVIVDGVITTLDGGTLDLGSFRGQPMLLVNTASKCGYTPQYEGLQELHERYGDRGLVVVGFPSPDFGGQEFDSADEIRNFCTLNFGVTFPLSERVHVRGDQAIPLFAELTQDAPEGIRGEIKWNFTKFLIGPDGRPVARFETSVEPTSDDIVSAIEALLPADA
jgi:glutathione peroxidase